MESLIVALDSFGLTLMQRLFCEHYLSNGYNGTQAALSAGYSKNCPDVQAVENLAKPSIKKYIGNRMKEVLEKAGAGIEWRVDMLKKTAEASFNGEAHKEGVVNPAGVINAVAELNKMEGTYAAEKHAVLVEEDKTGKVTDLLKEYEKEF